MCSRYVIGLCLLVASALVSACAEDNSREIAMDTPGNQMRAHGGLQMPPSDNLVYAPQTASADGR